MEKRIEQKASMGRSNVFIFEQCLQILVKSAGGMNKNMTADCIWQTIEEAAAQRPAEADHVSGF